MTPSNRRSLAHHPVHPPHNLHRPREPIVNQFVHCSLQLIAPCRVTGCLQPAWTASPACNPHHQFPSLEKKLRAMRPNTSRQLLEDGAVDQEAWGCFGRIPYQPQCDSATPSPSNANMGVPKGLEHSITAVQNSWGTDSGREKGQNPSPPPISNGGVANRSKSMHKAAANGTVQNVRWKSIEFFWRTADE